MIRSLATPTLASPSLGNHRGFTAAVGILLAAPVWLCGWAASMPLPILGWAAAFLFLAVERDVHCSRIPNWLTFPAFGAAVLYGAFIGGPGGAVDALLGAGAAFALLLAPYAIGALGAGDVKAAMALGAGFGAAAVSEQLLLAIVIGGVFAAGRLAASGELGAYLRRWARMLATTLATRRLIYFPPAPGTAATRGLPFAVALALSVTAQMLLEIRV
jgi:prepilin peptidase CpaA